MHCSWIKKLNKLGLTGCTTLFKIENVYNFPQAPTVLLIKDLKRTLLHVYGISPSMQSKPLHGAQRYGTTSPLYSIPLLFCCAATASLHPIPLLCIYDAHTPALLYSPHDVARALSSTLPKVSEAKRQSVTKVPLGCTWCDGRGEELVKRVEVHMYSRCKDSCCWRQKVSSTAGAKKRCYPFFAPWLS